MSRALCNVPPTTPGAPCARCGKRRQQAMHASKAHRYPAEQRAWCSPCRANAAVARVTERPAPGARCTVEGCARPQSAHYSKTRASDPPAWRTWCWQHRKNARLEAEKRALRAALPVAPPRGARCAAEGCARRVRQHKGAPARVLCCYCTLEGRSVREPAQAAARAA